MAVKTYSLKKDGKKMLSAHFAVSEFASTNGSKVYSDTVLIDTALITLLEKVFAHFKCSKIIISSGYRTAEHDKAVGGSGSGYHVKGQAADFCCYNKNGKQINSKKVACYLEDISCYGIGYKCGGNQYYTHADTRTAACKWWGDESKNFKSITTINGSKSFYDYLGIEKTTATDTKKTMKISTDGINLIKSFEGLSLKAYKAVSTEKYYTIGYGHYGADVKPTQTITEAEAEALLKSDITTYENAVNKALKVSVTQSQYDSMVSLCYNIGTGGFTSSDMVAYLNKGNLWKAASEFPLWRKSGGAILVGLQNRREKELRNFIVGCSFKLNSTMNVRKSASTSATILKTLAKGKSVKVTDVKVNYSPSNIDIWCKCSAGWICFKQGNTHFVD
ncbi:MAG: glycoside hydrolase family protein [Ruminococcus sp.]|nr:glycoside hydrolase family protein [Ruminococcus sp.]